MLSYRNTDLKKESRIHNVPQDQVDPGPDPTPGPTPGPEPGPDTESDVSNYDELAQAIQDAAAGDTINLIADITSTEPLIIDKNLTINLGGHNLEFTNSQGIVANGQGNIVTITDSDNYQRPVWQMNMISPAVGGKVISNGTAAKAQNGAEICLDKVNIVSTGDVAA